MWEGKKKAVTFSYDDGISQDIRLVGLFNYYHVKATFNLNSGIQSAANGWEADGISIRRMNVKGLKELYKGHEAAVHCLTHASLTQFEEETIYNELTEDMENLKRIFGYEMKGMAYPYGSYNDLAVEMIRKCGLKYARTVNSTGSFAIPENYLLLHPTCHHDAPDIMELVDKFLDADESIEDPALFYIWGHSYEFDINQNWAHMETILDKLAGRPDVYYGTNAQVLLER